jgi:hypothetical protein
MADQPRQADGAEIDQGHAEAAAEDAEGRILRDHAHVGPQRQLHAARDRKAFDRGDHRLRQPQPARAHRRDRVVAADLALLLAVALGDRLQIRARAKIAAGAGEHRDGSDLVGVERKKRVIELARGGAIDRVSAMRTVDGDDGDRAIAFDQHGIGFGHGAPPPCSSPSRLSLLGAKRRSNPCLRKNGLLRFARMTVDQIFNSRPVTRR